MARLKAPFTEAEVEAVIKLIDIDGSGDLDFDVSSHLSSSMVHYFFSEAKHVHQST